ncbi:UPF0764 protein C16orf89 [Eumeta japonica]|uniref:UPF0764 protein C16orf89 n=1 Tax=Eumeta variegata TaxID=151549 RepID=A0A4C1UN68_EUMVA|nr:UPF0764 protein C16orf89 [Eumeta japonica]
MTTVRLRCRCGQHTSRCQLGMLAVTVNRHFFLVLLLTHTHTRCEIEKEENHEFNLFRYIESIDEVVQFVHKYRNNIYINLGLGLLIAKVNLKAVVRDIEGLPESILSSILRLDYELEKTMKYFYRYQVPEIIRQDKIQANITSLLNETTWLRRIRKFEDKVLITTLRNAPVVETLSWDNYIQKLNQGPVVPDQYQSVICIASVGENPINTERRLTKCQIHEECYEVILSGTSVGYALTHRLMIILAAHFGRNCYIFSRSRDEVLIREMCAWTLKEAQYIAEHGYKLRDLMMEQISLCALNGYSEFLQHVWFSKFLELQSTTGCFAEEDNGDCKEHATAAAVSSISAAVRFLCQELY